jgi:uncharacterized protein (DUF779 family)
MTVKISALPRATALLERLEARHGALSLHMSGSYGVSLVCLPATELRLGSRDVLMGDIQGTPFYMMTSEIKYWRDSQLIVDVAPGVGVGFSLEGPEGVHFTVRKRSRRDWSVWFEARFAERVRPAL